MASHDAGVKRSGAGYALRHDGLNLRGEKKVAPSLLEIAMMKVLAKCKPTRYDYA